LNAVRVEPPSEYLTRYLSLGPSFLPSSLPPSECYEIFSTSTWSQWLKDYPNYQCHLLPIVYWDSFPKQIEEKRKKERKDRREKRRGRERERQRDRERERREERKRKELKGRKSTWELSHLAGDQRYKVLEPVFSNS
jgi:hypothetical protein